MQKLYELSAKDAAAEFGDPLPADEDDGGIFTTDEQEISGLGIEAVEFNDEEEENTISELLNSLNDAENADMADAIERERREREEYLRQEEENYQKRLASVEEDYNRKRYEAEQAAKKERLAREAEERRLEEEEEERAKEATFMGKLGKFFKKKPKNEPEAESVAEPVISEPEVEALETPKPEREIIAASTPVNVEAVADNGAEEEPSFDFDLAEALEGEGIAEEDEPEITTPQSEAINPPEEEIKKPAKEEVKKPVKEAKPRKEKPVKEKNVKEEKAEKKSFFDMFKKPAKPTAPVVPVEEYSSRGSMDVEEPDWKYIALHDEPTGMLNSRAYHDAIKKAPNTIAVVFFDINNLKYVNDNFSHQDGDALIKHCTESIIRHFGEDRVYRIGGDEFVALLPKDKNLADYIADKSNMVHKDLQAHFKASEKHVPHAVSIGYAMGDGEHTVDEIIKAADAMMYRNKKAYKQSHPDYNMRGETPQAAPRPEKVEKDHDELLSKDQKGLKDKIRNKHQMPTAISTKTLIREIQKKAGEVHAILIASPTFDHLFIIRNVDEFIALVLEQEAVIDYSYLYVVWDGGSQYYGADEYYNEVTDIFKEIAEGLVSGKFKSEKDVRSVKGINIFRNVYL